MPEIKSWLELAVKLCYFGSCFPRCFSLWRHQIRTFSALLALCAGNSPATGEFPSQMPVTWSFDVSFGLCLNERLSKQSWGWWFETPSRSLWHHSNVKSETETAVRSKLVKHVSHSAVIYILHHPSKRRLQIHEERTFCSQQNSRFKVKFRWCVYIKLIVSVNRNALHQSYPLSLSASI